MSKSVRWAFDFLSWNPTLNELVAASRAIAEEERKRIGQFVFQKDVRSSLVGRLMIRRYLEGCGVGWAAEVGRDSQGKPYAVNYPELKFSVSHQGSLTVLAGECGPAMLGADVMKQEYLGGRSVSEFFRLMDRQFSAAEWRSIKACREPLSAFCRHWALKESYVKGTGTGITVDLREISFETLSDLKENTFTTDTRLTLSSAPQPDWLFQETLLADHCVSVALCRPPPLTEMAQSFTFLDFQQLIDKSQPVSSVDIPFCQEFLAKEVAP